MRILLMIILSIQLFALSPYLNSALFMWGKEKQNNMNNNIVFDENVSFTWNLYFNDKFLDKYNGKKVVISEIHEVEYPCWDKETLKSGKFQDNYHLYIEQISREVERTDKHGNKLSFSLGNNWALDLNSKEDLGDNCKDYRTKISHDKVYVYVNETFIHKFEFTITPKNYQKVVDAQTVINKDYKPFIKTDYSKLYPNSPQIVLKDLHIYKVNKLSYFRKNKDIIFVEAESGSFAIPRKKLSNAKFMLFTQELNTSLQELNLH